MMLGMPSSKMVKKSLSQHSNKRDYLSQMLLGMSKSKVVQESL